MINNQFYKELGERWYSSRGGAVALLRIEKRTINPWCIRQIERIYPGQSALKILDVGCGGGFLTLELAQKNWKVTGVDVSESILEVGRSRDTRKEVNWVNGTAENLPLPDRYFDVVCMMDVLEHVHEPRLALKEASRVLKPGGTFIFHTFNRTWLSWLFAVKGLNWFIKDSVKNIHDWSMFIKPSELEEWMNEVGLELDHFQGIRPRLWTSAFFKLLFTRRVSENFSFKISRSLAVGYLGVGKTP
jgi:2-polyprenyl-6-hydroxyphenyl methylase/3-demethylubiquinone-9 3-methyltransferase